MGNSASSLPYTVGDATHPPNRPGSYGFAIHDGSRKSDGLSVTVLKASKADLVRTPLGRQAGGRSVADPTQNQLLCAIHHFRRCKTLVHPNLLRVYATLDTDHPNGDTPDPTQRPPDQPLGADVPTTGELIVVTERAVPLEDYLDSLPAGAESAARVAWGLHNLVSALGFLHNTAKLAHGAVCPHSVYVTPAGDFRLFNYSLLTTVGVPGGAAGCGGPTAHFRYFERGVTPTEYRSPERMEGRWDEISTSAVHGIDSYGLGVLIGQVYGHPGAGTGGKIPLKLQKAVSRLVSNKLRMRPRVVPLLKCPVFDTPYVHAQEFLDNMAVAPEEEKIRFIQSLPDLLGRGVLGRDVAVHKVLPVLVGAVTTIAAQEGSMAQDVNRRTVLATVPPLFCIVETHLASDADECRVTLTPIVQLLFQINDRGVRGSLLSRVTFFSQHLDKAVLNSAVFEPMCSGFSDSSKALRELTLKASISLVSYLNLANLDKLVRYLIRLQNDPEPSIRTNTAIFVGKVAPNLSEQSRQRLILPAFERAMKDDFKPCRLAALQAVQSCKDYYGPTDVSTKVMPAVVSHLLDPSTDVREAAFKVVESFMVILRLESAKMMEEESRRVMLEGAAAGMGVGGSAPIQGASSGMNATAANGEAPSSGSYLSTLGSWAAGKVVASAEAPGGTSGGNVSELPGRSHAPAPLPTPSPLRAAPPKQASAPMQQPRQPAAPAFASLSLSDANIGGGGKAIDSGGWSDEDDFDPTGNNDNNEDFFSGFGSKASTSAGLKIGGLNPPSKPTGRASGTKKSLVMPGKSKASVSMPPRPSVTKMSNDDDIADGWDDF